MTKTCVAFVGDDAYEIIYSEHSVDSIIRYKHGMNVRGEVVEYDALPYYAQLAIYKRLKRELTKEHDAEDRT